MADNIDINVTPIIRSVTIEVSNGVTGPQGIQGIKGDTGESFQESFESVSKNLKSYIYTLNYTDGKLTSIVYTLPTGTITKTLNYTGEKLTSIVLSGDTPSGITLTKNLNYTNNILTSINYN